MRYEYWAVGIIIVLAVAYMFWGGGMQAPPINPASNHQVLVYLTRATETDMEFVPVVREVMSADDNYEAIALLAIRELVAGPTALEAAEGLSSGFNEGTEVNYIRSAGNTVIVDFNETFDTPMGGSMRVRSLSGMIQRTIQQFPVWENAEVQFTINRGERAAVLEP
ncbi:hypothetical protein A2V68_02055 [candidate division Kazan bacterium RBG_13_50_9]|uniref:GerMN domain-containing protein n=1 Tax=candidate division Kazan bacterium RBG_13_50_9 TaxID=1798535 RepID=A0A1F4NS43_UNCK3|nr:MAG: hypothetical protein A2V68_02055 [candidate division Kazan bacterium RBG_13_50_9]